MIFSIQYVLYYHFRILFLANRPEAIKRASWNLCKVGLDANANEKVLNFRDEF